MKRIVGAALCLLSWGVCLGSPAHAAAVWTTLTGVHTTQPAVKIGDITGQAGQSIVIDMLGIGGDADSFSGPNIYRLVGGGIDITWGAGNGQGAFSATYVLDPTPDAAGPTISARGFSYMDINLVAALGASLEVFWVSHFDYDGRYTYATDALGNFYNDSAFTSSIRPWIAYDMASLSPVPLPAPVFLLALALGVLAIGARWRKRGTLRAMLRSARA
jgi:hypothetical protein